MATFNEYEKDKIAFAKKHNKNSECKVYTSPMMDNRWHKEIVWDDGHIWFEITELVVETADVEVHGLKTWVSIELWRTEYWTTESKSKFMYELA